MSTNRTLFSDNQGFSLIEIVIAMVIVGVASSGMYLAANSLRTAKYKTEVVSQALILDEMLQASIATFVPESSADRDLLKQEPTPPTVSEVGALIKINTPGFYLSTNATDFNHDFNDQDITLVSSLNDKIRFRLQTKTCVNGVKDFKFGYSLSYESTDERLSNVNWRSGTNDSTAVNLSTADCKLNLPATVFGNYISCPIETNDTSIMVGFDKNRNLPYCLKKQDAVAQSEIQTGYEIIVDPITFEQKISPILTSARSLSCGLSSRAPFRAISAFNLVSMLSNLNDESIYTYGSGPNCENSALDIPNVFATSWATYFGGIYRYGEGGMNFFRSPVVPSGSQARISFSNACPPGYIVDQATVNCRVYSVPGNINIAACQASFPSDVTYSRAVFTYTSPVTTTTIVSNYELRLMSYGCRVKTPND